MTSKDVLVILVVVAVVVLMGVYSCYDAAISAATVEMWLQSPYKLMQPLPRQVIGFLYLLGEKPGPEGAKNQVEGSIVMGLGTALYEAMDFQDGRLLNASFARYRVPRITNAPAIDVALVGDPETPSSGAGEPGIVSIAPAISNAVFDRTGERFREIPIQRLLR